MSPTSYQAAPPRNKDTKYMGPRGGCQPLERATASLEWNARETLRMPCACALSWKVRPASPESRAR